MACKTITVARDWRDDRIEELEALVRAQQATIEAQQRTIAMLEGRIRELEARLARYSGNSSQPPSSDRPGAPPPAPPQRTGRRRGAQPGHPRYRRELVPPERVTQTQMVKPVSCRGCGEALAGDDPDPYRHQVIDIPKVGATVEEYQLHTLVCEGCGLSTRAGLPAGVPTRQFGPRLAAMVSLCSGDYRMSKREIERLVEDFFGVPIALGSIANLEQEISESIAAPVEQLAQAIGQQPVVHADETGWYERSRRAWVWGAIAGSMALFLIRACRGAAAAKELLGATFAGVLVSDRWTAYVWVDVARRQLCWAHLLRQFRGFQDLGPEAAKIGRALELLTETMFHAWHRVREGTLPRSAFLALIPPLRGQVTAWLQDGQSSGIRGLAGRCREILELERALWTFVDTEGVEPTNNAAERILRRAVLWRKGSFGTDSPKGSRFVERILTVVTTLRLQNRNVLDYITTAYQAHLCRAAAPSLLSD